jgi:beta-glucanase (GH16 family)
MQNPRTFGTPFLLALLTFFSTSAAAEKPAATHSQDTPLYSSFLKGIDGNVWRKAAGTFDGNGLVPKPEMVICTNGYVSLLTRRLPQPEQGRSYAGGGLFGERFFLYGTFTVRMKAMVLPGFVASFFLMGRAQSGRSLHREIAIGFPGKNRSTVRFALDRTYADTDGQDNADVRLMDLPFDTGAAWHEYSIVWEPKRVAWLVDGHQVHETSTNIPDEPMNINLNQWLPQGEALPETLDTESLSSEADFMWVSYDPLF